MEVVSPLVSFCYVFIDIAQRIAASLLVQLIANAIVSKEPTRTGRIVSLLTITVFFVFLQSGATVTLSRASS